MAWLLQIGFYGANPGRIERYSTKTEALECLRCQAIDVDKWNGLRVEKISETEYAVETYGYVRIIEEIDITEEKESKTNDNS